MGYSTDKYENNWDDIDYQNLLPKGFDDPYTFSSGKDATKNVLDIAIASITHPIANQYLNKFYESGGEFIIEHLNNGNIMEYDFEDNTINIDYEILLKCFDENNLSKINSCIIHELHHFNAYKSAKELGHDLGAEWQLYNEKTVQIIDQGLEVGANYFQIIAGWEQGGHEMFNYLSQDYGSLAFDVRNFLERNNIKLGEKIPNKLLTAISDMTTVNYTETQGTKYKKALARTLTPDKCNPDGKGDISSLDIFKIMDVPTSFSEEELLSKLLFNKDIERDIPLNVYPFVTMAPNGYEDSINKKIEAYLHPKEAISIKAIKDNSR